MLMGACSALLFLSSTISYFVLLMLRERLLSWHQVSDVLRIGCYIVVGDQAYHCCVVSKLNDGVGVVLGHAVVGEQGGQEGTEHAPPRGTHVEDQRGICVVAYPYHLGAARQEVQDPEAEGGV
jgi:hypothetical protein